MKDLVSIILPVYNGSRFLRQSIESVLNQSYGSFELIIIDDCSEDESFQIVQEYANHSYKIKSFQNFKNLGLPSTLNYGHSLAKGNYLTWTSDDNIYNSRAIEEMIKFAKETQRDFVYANCEVIDGNDNIVGLLRAKEPENLYYENCIGACFLYSKNFVDKVGNYNPERLYLEDYDYWLRGLSKFRLTPLNKTLYKYRLHETNLTAAIKKDQKLKRRYNQNLKELINSIEGMTHELAQYFLKAQNNESHYAYELVKKTNLLKQIHSLEKNTCFLNFEIQKKAIDKLINLILYSSNKKDIKALLYLVFNRVFWKMNLTMKLRLSIFKKCIW